MTLFYWFFIDIFLVKGKWSMMKEGEMDGCEDKGRIWASFYSCDNA